MGQEDRDWFRERRIDYLNGGLLPPDDKNIREIRLKPSYVFIPLFLFVLGCLAYSIYLLF